MGNDYGRKGALSPTDTSETELYACPASTELLGGVLNITNRTSNTVTYRIAHTDASGAAADEDWSGGYDTEIFGNDVHQIAGITMGPGETIRVRTDTPNSLSFVLTGMEKS